MIIKIEIFLKVILQFFNFLDCISEIYNEANKEELSKEEFKHALLHNKIIRSLIDKVLKIIKSIDKIIQADLEKMIQMTMGKYNSLITFTLTFKLTG